MLLLEEMYGWVVRILCENLVLCGWFNRCLMYVAEENVRQETQFLTDKGTGCCRNGTVQLGVCILQRKGGDRGRAKVAFAKGKG